MALLTYFAKMVPKTRDARLIEGTAPVLVTMMTDKLVIARFSERLLTSKAWQCIQVASCCQPSINLAHTGQQLPTVPAHSLANSCTRAAKVERYAEL
jgi:hypothetical protein